MSVVSDVSDGHPANFFLSLPKSEASIKALKPQWNTRTGGFCYDQDSIDIAVMNRSIVDKTKYKKYKWFD